MKCANCNEKLEQLEDGDEWVSPDGAIFCTVTDEIHARQLTPEPTINDIKREIEESV